uniref:Copia-like retroelement pol polyprotein n=1 Tax=Arabidopsis thaliana TaxID=3702 RepID=O82196_ARATH|nr:copia-like retroelement pol polyprotein [Arabidopsis thaliana]
MGLKDALVERAPLPPLKEEDESDPAKKKQRIEEEKARIDQDEKAMDMIFINVGDKVLRNIENSKTAAEAWATLDKLYLVKSLPNRVYLQLKVYNYRMQDSKTLEENVDEFQKMISDLNNLQIQVPDEVQAILILSALPDSYDMLKETLKYGREGIKLDDVISAAKSKELELRDSSGGSRPVGEGLYVRGKSQARGSDGPKSTEGKKVCWICGKEGHFKRQCYKWLEKNKANGAGETALVKDDAQDLVGLVASEVNMSEGKDDQEEWIMDTGCSFHMTPRKEYLMDFVEAKSGKVRMANNSFSEVKGIGKVKFIKKDGTNDWSRKVWVYFLKTKDEAFASFTEWKKMVETQSERKLKHLRTDNGLEFCNHKFDEVCKKEGIVRHRTCTYTPQQNGVAERLNRTIMNKVRSMLSESGLDKKFWAKAASTAVYLINRSPSSSIENKIPEELWTSAVPNFSGLKRFGCVVYVYSQEGKLDPRAKKGVFVGYPNGVKGFRVWMIEEERCSISRNVVFREDVMYKDILNQSTSGMSFDFPLATNRIPSFECAGNRKEDEISVQGGVSDDDTKQSSEESPISTGSSGQNSGQRTYQIARDKPKRQTKIPDKLRDYELNEEVLDEIAGYAYMITEDGGNPEPNDYQKALQDSDYKMWLKAVDEEIESLLKNNTWVLVNRDQFQKPIGCKWVFKRKSGIVGVEKPRFKARLVVKGYSQKEGIDYQEIFSPVVKHVSIRLLLSMVTHCDMELQQMDVKTAFLHGYLDETIYIEQPEGYVHKRYPDKVCLLKRSLYGLRQSPRQWNNRFNEFMQKIGYERSKYDSCVYFKELQSGEYIYLLLYVDDILIASRDKRTVCDLKALLNSEFEMKDLGDAKKILGMEIVRDRKAGTMSISQEGYLLKVLGNFGMDQAKPVFTPMGAHFKLKPATDEEVMRQSEVMRAVPYQSAVGSLMYSMIGTRPDLAHSVGLVCRFMSKPLKEHWQAVKWILRYIRGSIDRKLCYKNEGELILEGYCDSDYAADKEGRRSTSGVKVVALSSTEAEYMALTDGAKEAIWLKGHVSELGFVQKTVNIHCDSQSAIALAKNAVYHERTKHIDVKYHFIRDLVNNGEVQVLKIDTEDNPADIFTKVLPVSKFQDALELLRVSQN